MLRIELSPSGLDFRLYIVSWLPHADEQCTIYPSHFVDIEVSEKGAALLAHVLQAHAQEPTAKIGTEGAPTQAQVLEALMGEGWGEPLQLAGDRRRFAEIKSATGVKVRRFDDKGRETNLELSDLFPELADA